MARSGDIQYVRFYSAGSAARQLELPEKKAAPARRRKARRAPAVIKLDGLAAVGTAVALVMLVCMLVGFVQLSRANAELEAVRAQVCQLELENQALRTEYEHGYDLEAVRIAAQSMGMIPAEQTQHITVDVPQHTQHTDTGWWASLIAQLRSLFA
jgi:hypothetical protein